MIDAMAVVDKPPGMTSHDVVARCRRTFGQKRVGHGGTLDPDATGVLLVAMGRATRLLRFLSGLPKSYFCTIALGTATSTLDASGEVTGTWDMSSVGLEDARRAAAGLTGTIEQVPPMVSAVKVGGRRLHELARAGVEVERPVRRVTVTRFALEDAGEEPPAAPGGGAGRGRLLAARVDCSSGTYVRALAADLGEALGGGAHVRALRRTAVGPWGLDQAVPLESLESAGRGGPPLPAHLLVPSEMLPWIEPATVGGDLLESVRHGAVVAPQRLGVSGEGPWKLLDPEGSLVAVYEPYGGGRAKPAVVL